MANKIIDVERWNDPWFRSLPYKYFKFWVFINDMCDFVGLYPRDFNIISAYVSESIEEEEIKELFKNKIIWLERHIFIPEYFINTYKNHSYKHRIFQNAIKRLREVVPEKVLMTMKANPHVLIIYTMLTQYVKNEVSLYFDKENFEDLKNKIIVQHYQEKDNEKIRLHNEKVREQEEKEAMEIRYEKILEKQKKNELLTKSDNDFLSIYDKVSSCKKIQSQRKRVEL